MFDTNAPKYSFVHMEYMQVYMLWPRMNLACFKSNLVCNGRKTVAGVDPGGGVIGGS